MPIDLERAQFRRSFRGFSPAEVTALLGKCADEMTRLLEENQHLRERLNQTDAEITRFRAEEDVLRNSIMLAQRTADETRASAQKQAELIVQEARQGAQGERLEMQQKVNDLRWEIEQLRAERKRFVDDTRAMLERQLRELDAAPLEVAQP
ncbi:MAG: DivIVA domain-containing protein [Fimbriimonas sp.]